MTWVVGQFGAELCAYGLGRMDQGLGLRTVQG